MKEKTHRARLFFLAIFFMVILIILVWRLYDLTVLNRSFLQSQGNARSLRVIDIPAYRGMITDRNGAPLAISTPIKSVWINPQVFSANQQQLVSLARLLQLSPKELSRRVAEGKGREFVYLKRQLPPTLAGEIAALHISGLHFQNEFKRYYPQGESAAQLIGFTNIDDKGIEGLELAYNEWLEGITGKKRVLKDRMGRIIEELDLIKEPRPGHDLRLSIDRRIQFFAYHALQETLNTYGAKSGSVVVLDSESGELLAVANAPSFNPNARSHYQVTSYRNKAMTDVFEPGSVMKPFSIASALASGQFSVHSLIDTRPSWMVVHGHTIRDLHNYGVLDVTGVLQHSSNVGVSKMVLASPPEHLIDLLARSGIGQRTDTGYPGESEGALVNVRDANPFVLATLSFGYGMSLTALQLAKSYLIFAHQGQLIPISLLHYDRPAKQTPVISTQVASQVLQMMEAVVGKAGGTGKQARIRGYRVAGKTGTARIAGQKGYETSRHVASFVGIAPVSKPRLVVAVVIHEPRKISYYGGAVAAPLFAKVMEVALRLLDVAPDELTEQKSE